MQKNDKVAERKQNDRPERKPRKFVRPAEDEGIFKKTVATNRITKVVKGGRTLRFNALVVVGDKKGKVGVGMGKSAEVPLAVEKATQAAKKNMKAVSLCGTTIPHEVIGKFGKSMVKMLPAKEGNGIIAGSSVRAVVELVGIKDITAKAYGSRNKVNCVKATIDALMQLKTKEEIASLRGKTVEEIL